MRHLTFIFCSFFTTFVFSQESLSNLSSSFSDQIATLNSDASELIGGVIHPLSGYPYLHRVDLIAKGAQEIQLDRFYIGSFLPSSFHPKKEWDQYYLIQHLGKNNRGWQYLPYGMIKVVVRTTVDLYVPGTHGAISHFTLSGPNYSNLTLALPPYAISNVSQETPGGQFDIRNTKVLFENRGSKITITSPDGTERLYTYMDEVNPYQLMNSGRTEYFCRLTKEILPNGKVLKYSYDAQKALTSIESLDPHEQNVYASILVKGHPSQGKVHFTSSSSTEASYTYQKEKLEIKFKEKTHGDRHEVHGALSTQFLTSVSSPFYRHENSDYTALALLSGYFGEKEAFLCSYTPYDDGALQHYKVSHLDLPVGVNDTFLPVYQLTYDQPIQGKKEGKTTVKNSDGTSTIYSYSKNMLLTSIQFFAQDGALRNEKRFHWDSNNWLKTLEILDDKKMPLYQKSYQYDQFGNPILEAFTGDLTGSGSIETTLIKREFSQDGKHLLLKEEYESGKILSYEYLPTTNLVTKKLLQDGDTIFQREFYLYDDCFNLIRKIIDDGKTVEMDDLTGVTEGKFTDYVLRTKAPFLHMVESVIEKYTDQGEDKLLHQTYFTYDQYGNIAREDHYDSTGAPLYTIKKIWNERGDLLSETNPLGQTIVHHYDEKGRCTSSTSFSGNLKSYMYYDVRNRLRELTQVGKDEISHILSYHYDYHDRLIYKSDQNWISYTYDPVCNQVIKTDLPAIASVDQEPILVATSSAYDAFGREIKKIDANGFTTSYSYNAYGSPVSIIHPDGSQESFLYTKEGVLESYTDQEGKTTFYEHDILGRVLSKTYQVEKNTIGQETYAYTSFHLISETDLEGNVSTYKYDGAGRKISEDIHGKSTSFTYNSQGQLATVTRQNRENSLLISYQRDVMDRILEESHSDAAGNLLYKIAQTYDASGNISSTTRFFNEKKAVESFTYDSFDRLIAHTDALGFSTKTAYNELYTNELQLKTLQSSITGPAGLTTVITYDPFERVVKKEMFDHQMNILSRVEKFYDPSGNLLENRDHIYGSTNYLKTVTTRYCYNSLNQLESFAQAVGSPDERMTSFVYSPKGKILSKTPPSGTTLFFTYDPFDYLQSLSSSDGQIDYAYEHNRLGHLLQASDLEKGISFEREVDSFGNVVIEEFSNHSVIKKSYDAFDRPLSINVAGPNFSNQGKVFYSYDPLFLRSVTRKSAQGVSYCHRYTHYDLEGKLVSETPIGTLGAIIHTYDSNSRKTAIISPSFTERYTFDSRGNIVRSQSGETHVGYEYDALSHLKLESKNPEMYRYSFDSTGIRLQKNEMAELSNDLGELIYNTKANFTYDLNGNLVAEQSLSQGVEYAYDPLGRMIQAKMKDKQIDFTYDPLNRQMSKILTTTSYNGAKKTTEEIYLYDEQYEIGSFAPDGTLKAMRVLGLALPEQEPLTIAVEMNGKVLAPMIDAHGTIRRLVDTYSSNMVYSYEPTSFGELWKNQASGSVLSPWNFGSKRFDPDLNLVYFGNSYYDPEVARSLNPIQATAE